MFRFKSGLLQQLFSLRYRKLKELENRKKKSNIIFEQQVICIQ